MASQPSQPQRGKRRFCTLGYVDEDGEADEDESTWNRGGWASSTCFFFNTPDGCKKGSTCKYRHIEEKSNSSQSWTAQHWNSYYGGYNSKYRKEPCAFFQTGCCYYDWDCNFSHEYVEKELNLKTTMCAQMVNTGTCSRDNCPDAHRREDLETPRIFRGQPGYKAGLCTYFLTQNSSCNDDMCFFAHGELDLRRLPVSTPRCLAREEFVFCDAHVHLDHVLLSRKYGCFWFYKFAKCKRSGTCPYGETCMFVHQGVEPVPRPIVEADFKELADEIKAVSGTFGGCVHNCCDEADIDLSVRLVKWGEKHLDGRVYVTFGVHPTNFEEYTERVARLMQEAVDICGKKVVGWGECGLDYYRRGSDIEMDPQVREAMKEAFRKQALMAVRRGLPLVLHSRDAEEDTLEMLYKTVPQTHPVHLHSFMGSVKCLLQFLDLYHNGYMGVAGAATYDSVYYDESNELHALIKAVPLDRLLLETDGPFMAPVPYRNEESHPGHIPWIAEGIARLKGVSVTEVLAATHRNFCRLYGIPPT